MASTQQLHPKPVCRELRDERAPRRLRALRSLCAVSVAGWLAFAAFVSSTAPESLPPDEASALVLAEIQALQQAAATAASQAQFAVEADEASAPAVRATGMPAGQMPRTAEPMKLAARLDLAH